MENLPIPSCPPQPGQPGFVHGTFSLESSEWNVEEDQKELLRIERARRMNKPVPLADDDSEYEAEAMFRHREVPSPRRRLADDDIESNKRQQEFSDSQKIKKQKLDDGLMELLNENEPEVTTDNKRNPSFAMFSSGARIGSLFDSTSCGSTDEKTDEVEMPRRRAWSTTSFSNFSASDSQQMETAPPEITLDANIDEFKAVIDMIE